MDRWSPAGVGQLFGKRLTEMNLEEFNRALSAVARCRDSVAAEPDTRRATLPSKDKRIRLDILSRIAEVLRLNRNDLLQRQEIAQKRQEEADRRREQAERAQAENEGKRQQEADECRLRCREKLSAMLNELRSLGFEEKSIKRLRDLDRERQSLIQQTPPDIVESLRSMNEAFVAEYRDRDAAAREAEEEAQRKKKAEAELEEKAARLKMANLEFLMMDTCRRMFPQVAAFFEASTALGMAMIEMKKAFSDSELKALANDVENKYRLFEPILTMNTNAFTECSQTGKMISAQIVFGVFSRSK
jgi:hypothetical protein